ncbi:hypothetical protein [Psychrobacter faecalis]|uniref:hypothetical protein n=1 Tax=Psychrobacter faecalis TaxID=180588 RepID=UPI0028B09FCA|nr:hypothetical protein [Psychrobacter faecalis]
MAISWYKNIKSILNDEPELWLGYLHGQQLNNLPHLSENKPRYRGLPLQLLKLSYTLIRTWRPFTFSGTVQNESYFVFAGTSNQMDSLDSTIDKLRQKGAFVTAITANNLLNREECKERYIPLMFSSTDILRAMTLTIVRGPYLYSQLNKLHPEAVSWWFSNFCLIYAYLAYFQRVLSEVKPKFVITANDHNVPNRCMLAVAHELGIETAYLQHASVSNIFPALRVNYAFLDGQCALDVYRQCEKNQPESDRVVPIPKVFLSGQKKRIKKADNKDIGSIGIALNSLDEADIAISFISQLASMEYHIVIRWHPGQSEREVKIYRELSLKSNHITLSEPKSEKVGDFLSRITWLVAGNSSIHLEAALAGVTSMYYELTPANISDYYGYVKNGLAIEVSSIQDVVNLINNGVSSNDAKNFIRYYSSTYQTEWEGREGELVAEILSSLSSGITPLIEPLSYSDLI